MQVPLRLFACCVMVAGLGAALAPWTIGGTHVRSGFATQIRQATGWNASVVGPITLKLLPRPRVQVSSLMVDDGRGSFRMDAAGLRGDLDVAALAMGRWRLTSATLVEPTITLDAQRMRMPGASATPGTGKALSSFKLAVRSGVIRIKSQHPGTDTLITDVNATTEQDASNGSLTLAGNAAWHATTGQFTARVEHSAALLRGGTSAASIELVSPLGAFLASGELNRQNEAQFIGHMAISAPSLPDLLRAFDIEPRSLGIRRALLSGDAVANINDVALSNIRLRLDQTAFEGTLAFRDEAGTPLIEGTLATDLLDLDKFAGGIKSARTLASWYVKPIDAGYFKTNVDLRVSAAASRFGQVAFEDSALSVLLRNGQMQVTLDEARAFEGTIKARALAKFSDHGLDGHADISVSGMDLGPLSSVISGQERISGTMTGHATIEGHGGAMIDIVHSLSGQGQVTVENGNFMGLSVTQALRRFSRKLPSGSDPSGQITTFDTASSTFNVENGVVTIAEGHVSGPGMRLQFGGRTDLQGGRIQLKAVAAATNAEGSVTPGAPRLPFEMRGIWGGPYMLVEHSTGVELPDFQLPFLDQPRVLR